MKWRSLFVDAFTPPLTDESEYWFETRRPFPNLVFLLPLLILYEVGVLLIGGIHGHGARNGADAWMRLGLQKLGIEILWLLPAMLVGLLLTWLWLSRQPWRASWDTLGGMLAESILFAFVLILIGQATDFCLKQATQPIEASIPTQLATNTPLLASPLMVKLVAFTGAGIYEEFLFRLCLIPITYAALRAFLIPHRVSVGGTIVITSLIFSIAHYLGPTGDGESLSLLTDAVARVQSTRSLWFGFIFRTLAGMFFAALFFTRGFGITVGSHAIYDVFVGIVLITEV